MTSKTKIKIKAFLLVRLLFIMDVAFVALLVYLHNLYLEHKDACDVAFGVCALIGSFYVFY